MSESHWQDLVALYLDHRFWGGVAVCAVVCVLGVIALLRASREDVTAVLRDLRKFLRF
ncbi:hypothetical protein ABZ606_18000 [Streptomyces sp. NPDC012461]|uniref:Uncharacterized protein n=2 Tax=unclassified Streptomyces TaxID=2593676 RepID=A0A6G3QMR9_9ACTN|nr:MULTISPECIES: hypothetical protein [unclassified Streptomyces]MBM7088279.1 hypothetical protein [Streptomyces sp. S12]NEA84500.1 hypothetical protein [Streptomyces sp. SID14436]NEC30811.1 hypothetical protein [Streptomyces sp. SID8111]NEC81926.1 hypothetical protein [Streptomyces sp. SID7958]NED20424.1 hypothetical protein [Streptomyces sp. SID9913]